MASRRTDALLLAVLVALFLRAGIAHAQHIEPLDEARARQAQGEAFFEAENFDAALVEFERVYALLEGQEVRYLVLFNIGQCQERLFRYDQALASYRRYLEEGGPDAEDRADVEGVIRALDGMLATLTIEVNVPEGEIWVDDRLVGRAPGAVRVPPGNHSVEVRAAGFSPARQEVQVSTHAARTMTFELEALGGGGAHPALFVTGAALTAVALGIGIGFGVEVLALDSELRNAGDIDPAIEQPRLQGLALTADVFYGVAGALAIGTVVVLFLTDWDGDGGESAGPAVSIAPTIGPAMDGLVVSGRF